ncbi:MAG: aminotransferase class V-fold PLP-dependent enzyme [Actinobacteria bacterium]|nr:MAG: aminotransferase class V-fold PLP-dependent enzyme [Actinomycetota bacterium]
MARRGRRRLPRRVPGLRTYRVPERGVRRPGADPRRGGRRTPGRARAPRGARRPAALRAAARDGQDVALTRSTTDGVSTVMSALRLGPGDEVLTSDEEHPGLLAPLEAARRRRGFHVRIAPFAELADAIGPRTRLVACSHVSWVGGRVVDAAALAASDAMVLLDGAQGLGAVPTNPHELGCDFYAASGQKWLCGPDGSGCLYVRRDLADELDPPWPNYGSLAFDMGLSGPLFAWSLESVGLLAEAGLDWVHERGAGLAARLANALAERGLTVSPRGRSTLVSWSSSDPEGDMARLAADGIVVRYLPGRGLVRASVGAWSSEEDLDRLVAAAVR